LKSAIIDPNVDNLFEIKFKNGIFLLYLQQEVFIDILFIFQNIGNQQKNPVVNRVSYLDNVELNIR